MKVYYTDKGEQLAIGNNIIFKSQASYLEFDIDSSKSHQVKPVIENGTVTGVYYDESIVLDPDTGESVPKGQTVQERLDESERQLALMRQALDEVILGGGL